MIVILLVIQKKKQMQDSINQHQLRYDYEQAILNTKIEVQEQVLATVSLELHDHISQHLSLGCIQLINLSDRPIADRTNEKIEEPLRLIKETLKDIRLLSHSLNTGLIENRALEDSISSELARIQAFSAISCKMILQADESLLTPAQKLIIFRIIQEALQNILKHAAATNININLSQAEQQFILVVEDNGIGFESRSVKNISSLGIFGMKQRASFLGSDLKIDSRIGKGTKLILTLPLTTRI